MKHPQQDVEPRDERASRVVADPASDHYTDPRTGQRFSRHEVTDHPHRLRWLELGNAALDRPTP